MGLSDWIERRNFNDFKVFSLGFQENDGVINKNS